MTKSKVLLLVGENITVWGGFILAINIVLPIVQVLAGLAAFLFSILSIIKIIKNWNEKRVN